MKNIIKKVVIIAILAVMALNLCAFRYETEEVPSSLIAELIEDGFKPSDDDPNIWEYRETETDEDGVGYLYAYYDTENNIGVVSAMRFDAHGRLIEVFSGTATWDNIEEEFVTISEMEYEW